MKNGCIAKVYQNNIQDLCFELIQDAKKVYLTGRTLFLPLIKLIENRFHIYKETNYELPIENEELHR